MLFDLTDPWNWIDSLNDYLKTARHSWAASDWADIKLTNILYEMMICSKFTECKGFLVVSLIHKMGLQNICQIWLLTQAPVNSSKEVPFSSLTHNSVSWLGVFLVEGWREFLWIIQWRKLQNWSNIDNTLKIKSLC